MKVLFLHNHYGKYSGEEAVLYGQIDLLVEKGLIVKEYFRFSEDLRTIPLGKIKAFFSGFSNPKVTKEVLQIINSFKPDLVHIHNLYPLIPPSLLNKIGHLKIPIVMTVHNYRLLCPNGLFYSRGEICERCNGHLKELNCIVRNCESDYLKSIGYASRNFYTRIRGYYMNNVDKYFCLTEFQKNKLISNGFQENKITVIPNFYIKEKSFDPPETQKDFFACVGRVSPEKGIEQILFVADKLKHIDFKIAGERREGYLQDVIIPDNVEFVGTLSKAELGNFYSKSIALIHPSRVYEGFPMVFPEAMSFKLPIIAPRMAGYPEIVKDELNGLLYDPEDIDQLIACIVRLSNNVDERVRFGNFGYSFMKSNFSESVYVNRLLIEYKEILNR